MDIMLVSRCARTKFRDYPAAFKGKIEEPFILTKVMRSLLDLFHCCKFVIAVVQIMS